MLLQFSQLLFYIRMAPLFIGACFASSSIPQNKPRIKSTPNHRINEQLHNNTGGVLISELGEEHDEYILKDIIEPCFREGLRNFEKTDWWQLVERVLKVKNTPEKDSRFQEQVQAQEDSQKGPCNLADSDEVWMFYGAPVSCSLGSEGSNATLRLCDSNECGLCSFLRQEKRGLCTTTSSMALKKIGDVRVRKAVVLCKVVPGRLDLTSSEKEHDELSRFNSGVNRNARAIYVRNSSALLPMYVVIYKIEERSQLSEGYLHNIGGFGDLSTKIKARKQCLGFRRQL